MQGFVIPGSLSPLVWLILVVDTCCLVLGGPCVGQSNVAQVLDALGDFVQRLQLEGQLEWSASFSFFAQVLVLLILYLHEPLIGKAIEPLAASSSRPTQNEGQVLPHGQVHIEFFCVFQPGIDHSIRLDYAEDEKQCEFQHFY